MKEYKPGILSPKQIEALGCDLSVGNDKIVETAGFEPLEVKLKRFEQNGIIAQFKQSDFTSSDLRQLYLNPDFDVTPEDDIEEVMEKLNGLRAYQKAIIKQVKARSQSTDKNEKTGTDGSSKPGKNKEDTES